MSTGAKKSRPSVAADARATRVRTKEVASRGIPGYAKFLLLAFAALGIGAVFYWPALTGQFVFDDATLPLLNPRVDTLPIWAWYGVRPVVNMSYWANYKLDGIDVVPYHVVSLVLHACCAALVFLIFNKILLLAAVPERVRVLAAAFCGAVFLLHPLQTESVSYIAARAEPMSAMFLLWAFYIFLARRSAAISFSTSLGVIGLFCLAIGSKEIAVVLPAVLLLTDYFWNPGFSVRGIKANWRLYVPLMFCAIAGAVFVFIKAVEGRTVGFNLPGRNPADYLLTQFRAIFIYFRLFLFPFGQTVSWDLPLSHSPLDRGAIFYGLALALIVGLAIYYRKRYRLASYGFLLTLLFLSPTSSIVPIQDPMAERRMYLPLIGLLFVACELITRARLDYKTLRTFLALVCLALGVLTYTRNFVWNNAEALWRDALLKRPQNVTAMMGLAGALVSRHACGEASEYLERAVAVKRDYKGMFDLASAETCAGEKDKAIAAYMDAAQIQDTPQVWISIAKIHMNAGEAPAAIDALARAQQSNPQFLDTYLIRGAILLSIRRFSESAQQFRIVLAGDPGDPLARQGLEQALAHGGQ